VADDRAGGIPGVNSARTAPSGLLWDRPTDVPHFEKEWLIVSDVEPTIEVLVCTFRRPHLFDTLESLAAQALPPGLSIGVIVADSDDAPSAREAVEAMAARFPHPLRYVHAPARNVSIARNACLAAATAPWVAFLDDDEIAPASWIDALWRAARDTEADYPPDAPDWMVRLDVHSTRPVWRGGVIETGYAGNALLRRADAPWAALRFDASKGQTGGEDTAFFFEAHRLGARFAEAPDAVVREPVTPERLSFRWLARRRFRMGQTYAGTSRAGGGRIDAGRLALLVAASAKVAACGLAALAVLPWSERRRSWTLRGLLHVGVVAGCLAIPEPRLYGR
jgi:succinoglycan biosynthesis protein ExoM